MSGIFCLKAASRLTRLLWAVCLRLCQLPLVHAGVLSAEVPPCYLEARAALHNTSARQQATLCLSLISFGRVLGMHITAETACRVT